MKSRNRGFTLIELVVVIVILGILSAVALPKFIDISAEARLAAVQGMAAGVSSGAAVNYGARKAAASKGVKIDDLNVCTKAAMDKVLTTPIDATKYTITGTGDCTAGLDGAVQSCTITDANSSTATAQAQMICTKP